MKKTLSILLTAVLFPVFAFPQNYGTLVDKTIATVGGEFITLYELESEVQMMKAQGYASDKNLRCEILESMLRSKLFLMQARIDSLTVNLDMVNSELNQRLDNVRTALGGDEQVEQYFGKSLSRLRADWRSQLEDMSLTQQEQQNIASNIPEVTPFDVKMYLDTVNKALIPEIPSKYRMSQICVYPNRDSAAIECKERLLALRERVLGGERFSTLARIYSQDPGSARKGGELGMASKSIFWPAFSDAAMSLKPGTISQIVETPDGFHIIEVIEKKGDMFNARHILLKPRYTAEDRSKAFERLDSIRTAIDSAKVTFELAARFLSEDPASRTNGGQMADPNTGSAYFEKDQLKPQDYAVVSKLSIGEISEPFESKDNEGRDGNTVYKILRLDKILPSHVAAFETDYDVLYQGVQDRARGKAVEDFIRKKISETHITIDPLFKDCGFESPEWKEKVRK